MSTQKQEVAEQLEALKSTFDELIEKSEELENEAEELRKTRREAEEKAWAAEERVKELTEEIEKTDTELMTSQERIKELEAQFQDTKARADQLESSMEEAVGDLRKERDDLKHEMDEINQQLSRVSELYRETAAEKEKLEEKVDVSDLLAIYITLIETVFAGKPHARVLYTLHDTGAAITRKNIEASTGIMPTYVIKAIHDLRNADLVSYDEQTQEVELIRDIL